MLKPSGSSSRVTRAKNANGGRGGGKLVFGTKGGQQQFGSLIKRGAGLERQDYTSYIAH